MDAILVSHLIDPQRQRSDDFTGFMEEREKRGCWSLSVKL
jgi:hypothetical protein